MTRSKSLMMVLSKLIGLWPVVRERSLTGLLSIHNVASFQAVGMYPIPSEKVKSLARWM